MIHYVQISENGAIAGAGTFPFTIEQLRAFDPGKHFEPVAEPVVASDVYWDGSAVQPRPPRPVPDASWDDQGHTWVMPPPPDAAETALARRAVLLRESDWVVARAYEQGAPVPEGWTIYRQELRDITLQAGYPHAINWPVMPD